MKKLIRIILINIAVLVGLLILLNFLCFLAIELGISTTGSPHSKGKVELPKMIKNDKSLEYNRQTIQESSTPSMEYVPYVGWSRKSFSGKMVTINEIGDRVHKAPKVLPDSASIVRFFGGSTMWGFGADDQGTIPAFFNTVFPDKRVYNHGESGFHSRQHLARLLNILNQQGDPGLVIFYDGHNDIANFCRQEVGPNEHVRKQQINESLKQAQYMKHKKFILKQAAKLVSYGYIKAVIDNYKTKALIGNDQPLHKCCYDEEELEKTADKLIANWQLAENIVKNHGGQFMAFLQPSAYINNTALSEKLVGKKKPTCMLDKHELIYRIIRKKLSAKPWFYDLSTLLDNHGDYYMDMVHVSAPANRIIAEKIAALVAEKENSIADEQ